MKTRKNPLFEKYYHFDLPPSERKEFEEKLRHTPTLKKEYEKYQISKNVEFELIRQDLEAIDLSESTAKAAQTSIAQDTIDLLNAIETLQLFAQAYEGKLAEAEKRGFEILLKADAKTNRQYVLYQEMIKALTEDNQRDITKFCEQELKKIRQQPARPANYQEKDSPRHHIILFFISKLFTIFSTIVFPPNLLPTV